MTEQPVSPEGVAADSPAESQPTQVEPQGESLATQAPDPAALGNRRRRKRRRRSDFGKIRRLSPAQLERTRRKKLAYLAEVARTGNISEACRRVGVSRSFQKYWVAADPDFSALYEEAMDVYTDSLEREVDRRAFEGVNKGVWYQGKQVGKERVYSDSLAMFRLTAELPEKYKHRQELTGPGGGPLQVATLDLSRLSEADLLVMRALRRKAEGLPPDDEDQRALPASSAPPPPGMEVTNQEDGGGVVSTDIVVREDAT